MSDQSDSALVDRVRRDLIGLDQAPTVGDVVNALADLGLSVTGPTLFAQAERIWAEIAGLGPLQPLATDREVTDILVVGQAVWVDRGEGMEEVADSGLAGEEETRALAVRLAASCGQRLDDASPIVDGTFPSGVRLHAIIPPLSAEGTLISLRTHRARVLTLA